MRARRAALLVVVAFAASCLAACGNPGWPSNWGGYVTTVSGLRSVSASWVQPCVFSSDSNSWVSFWVGLDGLHNTTVEQIGTEADGSGQQASCNAWFELYPAPSQPIRMTVHPGDVMTATVSCIGSHRFTLSLVDGTTGASFSTTQVAQKATASCAEVIAEGPTEDGWALADFDSVRFTRCACNGLPLGSYHPEQITLVAKSHVEATTSRLSTNGTSFAVTPFSTVASVSRFDVAAFAAPLRSGVLARRFSWLSD